MHCCLCIKAMDMMDEHHLYSENGDPSEIYHITWKYFRNQLRFLETSSEAKTSLANSVCTSCWQSISDFHCFQQIVTKAHHEFIENLVPTEQKDGLELKNTAFIKVEIEMPMHINENGENAIEDAPIIDTDPVKIEPQLDVLQMNHDEESNKSVSDDDKPLVRRLLRSNKTPHNVAKSKSKCKNKTSTKKRLRNVDNKINNAKSKNQKKNQDKPQDKIIILETQKDTENDCQVAEDEEAEEEEKSSSETARKKKEQDDFIAKQWSHQMKCGLCGESCDNFVGLRAHFRNVHNTSRSYVVCCQRKYFHRFHLVDHLHLHLNPEYFKCNICGKCLGNRRSLKTHMKEGHMPEPLEKRYECSVCHKRFAKAGILKGHMDIHAEGSKDFVCNVCGKGFVLKHRLAIHLRTVHDSTGGGVCEQCGKSFKDRYALRRHLLEHAGVSREKWPCDQCSAQLHSKFSLRRHKRVAHHDGTTVYRCSECGKIALTEDALRSHKKYMHEKKRIYKCNICDKAFKVAVVLKEHMTTHTGEDLYKCPHCPKTFKVCANMHHHRKRVHPKEWEETRQHRNLAAHTDLSSAANEVVM